MCVPTCFRNTLTESGPLFPEQPCRTPRGRSSGTVLTTRLQTATDGSARSIQMLHVHHCPVLSVRGQREPTVRVMAAPGPPPLRYISVSRGGQVTSWDGGLCVLASLGVSGRTLTPQRNRHALASDIL